LGIIRSAWSKLTGKTDSIVSQTNFFSSDTIVDDVCNYFGRKSTTTQIGNAIIAMYGTGIHQEQDPNNQAGTIETYVHRGFEILVGSGQVERFSVGFGNKIVNAHSTLFTEPGNRFSLVPESEQDTSFAQELLNKHREQGGFKNALVNADKMSIQCGSGLVYLAFENGTVRYRSLRPNSVRAFWDYKVEEDGAVRYSDITDIEDATYVIIRLGQVEMNKWNYLAIFGRSESYPNGRHVLYTSGNSIDVPKQQSNPSMYDMIEYELPGVGPCNPLSLWARQNPDIDIPEYPIAVINSCMVEKLESFPTYTTLRDDCLEFSRAASHTLGKSQEAASSTITISDNGSGMSSGKPLPRTLSGAISLSPGQKIDSIPHDSASCDTAYSILRNLMVDTAAGYYVPDFMVVSEDQSIDSSSGIALQIKTRPLRKFRQLRIEDNGPSVKKIFEIERALIGLHAKADIADVNMLMSCSQTWDAGDISLPENKLESANRISILMDKGIMDTIAAIREYYQLPTDEEAIALYDTMKEREEQYKPIGKEEPIIPQGIFQEPGSKE
jgi:hypothetical protein